MKNKLTPLLTIVLGIALSASVAKAQILTNGSFETSTVAPGSKTQNGFTAATGWLNIGTGYTDSGIQNGGGTGAENGTTFAFERSGEAGAYQTTGTQVNVGDLLTLTYFAVNSFNTPSQAVSLFTAASAGSSYASSTILATDTDALTAFPYTQYTLTDTVAAGQAGFVGVSFITGGGGNSYVNYDNFVLTVTPAPEPSTYALIGVGIVGFVLVRRFRHASV